MIPNEHTKSLRAFHGKKSVKDKYVSRVKAHKEADEIVKGKYWENGKGCAVGCTIEGSEHKRFETEIGVPESIAYVEDYLFEAMPNEDAKEFPLRLLEAIPVGADLSLVSAQLICYMLDDTLNNKKVQEDKKVKESVKTVLELWRKVVAGEKVEPSAWSAAESAAWSAARSAAESAAESAAWSAESAARSAAESAAWSAAWSAAESAAESAAWSAARSAAAKRYGDALIRFCSEAPVIEVESDDATDEAIALLKSQGYRIVKD